MAILSRAPSAVETPDFAKLFGKAGQAAKEGIKPFPQGLKPIDCQALNVGAKAPTPEEAFVRCLLNKRLRLPHRFLGLGYRDQLVPCRFRSTIPGLVEIGHRRSSGKNRHRRFLCFQAGSAIRRSPELLERLRPAAFHLLARGDDFLSLFRQPIHPRMGILPGIHERPGIELSNNPSSRDPAGISRRMARWMGATASTRLSRRKF